MVQECVYWSLQTKLMSPPIDSRALMMDRTADISRRQAPRVRKMERGTILGFPAIFAGVVVAFVFVLSVRPMAEQDIGWHLRNAQYFFQHGSFVRHDMYSYTTYGAPWINHEWLAEIPFYLAWQKLGDRGLYAVTLLTLEVIFLGVYLLSYRYCRDEKAACLVTVAGVLLGTVSFGPRTLLLGWVLLVAELLILQRYVQQRQSRGSAKTIAGVTIPWFLPPIFLVWVNTHGSWLIGFAVLLAFAAAGCLNIEHDLLRNTVWSRSERRHLALIVGLCFAALFCNPYGWHLVAYPFDLAYRQKLNIANVEEWQSLDFRSLRARILMIICGISLVRQWVRKRAWSPYALMLVGIGLYASLSYTRFLFLAAILVFPLLAEDFKLPRQSSAADGAPGGKALMWVVIVAFCFYIYRFRLEPMQRAGDSINPVKVLSLLSQLPPSARVLNSYDWGGYLELHVPSLPVFIDSRVDIFERSGVFADYLNVVQLKESLTILDKYNIDYVLFQPDTPLIYLLRQSSSWKVDYQDKVTILMRRVRDR